MALRSKVIKSQIVKYRYLMSAVLHYSFPIGHYVTSINLKVTLSSYSVELNECGHFNCMCEKNNCFSIKSKEILQNIPGKCVFHCQK